MRAEIVQREYFVTQTKNRYGFTLRDGFQQFRGVSPMQYVRQLRLERARNALRAAPSDVRVAEIALDCGFAHLGRFAMVYKAMFGESPSETLRGR